MKQYLAPIALVLVVMAGALWALSARLAGAPGEPACTEETKVCPDGSSVGRSGPNCEFAACPVATATSTPVKPKPVQTGIAIGKSATIHGVTIGVLELVEDSRCPVDVMCIWAGTVRVRASINAMNRDFTFKLGEPQVIANATITLTSVVPAQKNSRQQVLASDYRFLFTVVPINGEPVACTMEAKQCPDGSYVSRSGPKCEFALCPTEGSTSGVRGNVLLGPTCPVVKNPPDPACADKPYATTLQVFRAGESAIYAEGKSDAKGYFEISIPKGSYVIKATGGTTLPRCADASVNIVAGQYASTTISCDTGIR